MFKKMVLVILSISTVSLAAGKMDWKKCDREIKRFKCAGSDKDTWECLEKNDDKLSKLCQETHSEGDAVFGKK